MLHVLKYRAACEKTENTTKKIIILHIMSNYSYYAACAKSM